MKKLLLASILASAASTVSAQSVSYKTLSDDPGKYKLTAVYVDLFNADTYLGAGIGYGLKLETVLLKRLMPRIDYKYSYMDASTHHVVSDYPTSEGGLHKQMILDLGAVLFLANKEKKKNLRVVLSSYSTGRTTHTRYIMVPGTVKRMMGVEGGIYYNRKALEFDDASHELYNYKTPSGQEVPIEGVGQSSGNPQPSGESYKPLSMTNVASLYGGVHLRKVTSLFIMAEGRKKSNARVGDLYADVMLAPVVPIKDVIDVSGAKWGIEAKSGAIRHLGWRVGYSLRGVRTLGFQYNFEFGQKPGPKLGTGFMDNGTYISLGMGFSLAFRKLI